MLSIHVECRRNFVELSCTKYTGQENDFELIPTVKMETRNAIEGYFSSKFLATCNHCGFMVARSHKTKFLKRFFAFFGKTTPYGKIFKILC